MLTGILSYATSPMWLVVLVLSSIVTSQEAIEGHQYFPLGAYTLFPTWPEYREGEIAVLLSMTVVVLLLPKLLGTTLALANASLRRGFGGVGRLGMSLLLEQIFSMLLAPPMMVFHSSFVVSTLAGRPVTWNAQERGDRGITLLEALNRHKWHIVLGLVWGAAILLIVPQYIWWMSPVLAGLLLSAPLTMLSSRADLGRWVKRRRLLLTPEEVVPPPELAAAHTAYRHGDPSPEALEAGTSLPAVPAPAPLVMDASPPKYVGIRSALDGALRIATGTWPAGGPRAPAVRR